MSDLYKTFVMEIRPRLQSCNVFLIFKQNTDKNLTVSLKENEINILANGKNDIIQIADYKILINSLSSLQISNNYLTFRFQTEAVSRTVGQFKSEFVMYNFNSTNCKPEFCGNKLEKNVSYVVKCINCQGPLSDKVTFKRILPLPSDNVEPSEWFCHKHDDEATLNLNPSTHDCFYSNCYIHVNQKNFSNYRIAANSVIICKRCLAWLGLSLRSDTIQVWFNTVMLDSDNSRISSTALIDFINTVKCSLNESLLTSSKILFECCNKNYEYLCIWILEKNLQLYVKGHEFQHTANNSISDTKNVAKILFRFESEITDLVTEWLNDVRVNHTKISKPMMIGGLNHLFEMCQLIPDCFRKSNGFYVSYLVL